MRAIKYNEALAEALIHAMKEDPKLFVMGEGIDDCKGVFGSVLPAYKEFGADRIIDTPLSEGAVTGIGIGAAISGHPNIMIHMRIEFLLYAMDQVVNHAAKWSYMFGGQMNVPIVIRTIVGRGWGQAAQHSQSLHALFGHVPGLKVIMPATPYSAKGLLYSAIKDPNPVVCIEHRWCYGKEEEVPEESYSLELGKARVLRPGKDITCVAVSHQLFSALEAQEKLAEEGIEMEVIDLQSVRPLDRETILKSVHKTGRLIITDIGNAVCGISAEISAMACEHAFSSLKAPIARVALPDVPTPCSYELEGIYYPKTDDLVNAAKDLMKGEQAHGRDRKTAVGDREVPFTGPF